MPWGEAKPRNPQTMGAGTGMPGIIKASAPAEEEDKPEEPNPRPDKKPEPKDPQPPKLPEDDPTEEEGPASAEQCQLWQAACDRYRAKAQELDAKERKVSARQQHYQSKAKNLAKDGEDLAEVVADLASLAIPALRVPKALRGIYAAYQKAQDMRDVTEKTEKMSDLISDAQKRAFYQELANNLAQEAAAIHESAEYYHNEASKLRTHAITVGECAGFL